MAIVTFGLGGYCENCDSSHDHPLYNIVEVISDESNEYGGA